MTALVLPAVFPSGGLDAGRAPSKLANLMLSYVCRSRSVIAPFVDAGAAAGGTTGAAKSLWGWNGRRETRMSHRCDRAGWSWLGLAGLMTVRSAWHTSGKDTSEWYKTQRGRGAEGQRDSGTAGPRHRKTAGQMDSQDSRTEAAGWNESAAGWNESARVEILTRWHRQLRPWVAHGRLRTRQHHRTAGPLL